MNEKKLEEFKQAAQPLVDFLNKYYNPHCTIIVTQTSAEVLSGEMAQPFEPLD